MPPPLKPRGFNEPVTGAELANLVEVLAKEAATLRRSADVLAARLPQAKGSPRPVPYHVPIDGKNKPLSLVRDMRSAIRECDDALADIRWIRSRFDAWSNDAYLAEDVKAWVEQGEEEPN
jgi:hypothetical protein